MAKRGRPKSPDGESVKVNLRLRPALFDRICAAALRHDRPVTKIIIKRLERDFPPIEKSAHPQMG